MAAPYDYPNGTVDFIGVVSYVNTSLGSDIFGMGLLFVIFVLSMVGTSGKLNIIESTAISSFFTGILAILFVYMNLVSGMFAMFFMFLAAVVTAFMFYKGNK